MRWAIRLERTNDPEAIEILREYNLCKKFKCLPSELYKQDSLKIEMFEVIMDQESRELKKKQDEMHAKSLASMKKM